MDQIQKVILIACLFSVLSFTMYTIKARREYLQKLERDAQMFFEVICKKLLFPLTVSNVDHANLIFKISGTKFLIVKINSKLGSTNQKIIDSFDFLGSTLINNKTGKIFSYNCFESYLRKVLKHSIVSGYYIEYI